MSRFRLPLMVLMVLAAGCSANSARRPNAIPVARLRANPQLAEGQRVFMMRCNECHVGGAAGLGPSLNDKPLPGFLIKFQIRHGLGAMPAFGDHRIGKTQLDDIVMYLEYLRSHPEESRQS